MTAPGEGPPRADRRVPTSTYRLQVQAAFGFDDVAALAGYLADLGVSHAYLSPVLQAAPGSTHGYDVLDHTRLSDEAGGREGFDTMVAALHERGLGIVVDVVPNHMTVPEPEHLNAPLWSMLREGPRLAVRDLVRRRLGRCRRPGASCRSSAAPSTRRWRSASCVPRRRRAGRRRDRRALLRPRAPGPARDRGPAAGRAGRPAVVAAGVLAGRGEHLNYRRFFDVGSLAAVRVEDPAVFDATHALLVDLVRAGSSTACASTTRTGWPTPRGYLRRLAEATDDAWVVVEKILEGDERLPDDWPCAGTTGYDLLWRVGALFVDPAGEQPLTDLLALVTGARLTLDEVVTASKQYVVVDGAGPRGAAAGPPRRGGARRALLAGYVRPRDSVERALVALLVAMDRYRAYVVPGESVTRTRSASWTTRPTARASTSPSTTTPTPRRGARPGPRPGQRRGAGGGRSAVDDLVVRFQQTCGPVMAKGIEDTAFYRWHRLVGLNEVGGDPDHFAVSPDELDDVVERLAAEWPLTMTTLSTHDTKRSEDVRARLAVLSERPAEWHDWVREAQEPARPYRSERLDGATEYLLWQTLVGAWPARRGAAAGVRDQGGAGGQAPHRAGPTRTRSTRRRSPTSSSGVAGRRHPACARAVLGHRDRRARAGDHAGPEAAPAGAARASPTSTRAPRLVDLSLVDPDNRRPVDFARPGRATGPARRRRGARRPRRREAPRHQPGAAAAPRPPGVVHRRRRDRRPGAHRRRPRLRRRARRLVR